MKKTKLFVAALAALTLFSCNKQNNEQDNPAPKGDAYLAITLNSSTPTKANTIDNGTVAESKATTVQAILFDANEVCLGVVNVTGATIGNSNGGGAPNAAPSDAFLVPAATAKVMVVINNYAAGWNLTEAAIKGLKWDAINKTIDADATNIAAANNFMMVNRGALTGTPGSMTDASKGLVDVTVVKLTTTVDAAKNAAKNAAAAITVDRLAAKVSLTTNASGIAVTPTGATFTFNAWQLNTTNKKAIMYSNLIEYANATTTAAQGLYRIDANFTGLTGKDDNYLTTNYSIIKEKDVILASAASAYCLENTMEAASQLRGHTTKAIVKGQYTPAGLNGSSNPSYFSWNGGYIAAADMPAAYKANTGLRADLVKFLNAANTTTLDGTDEVAIDDAITALDAQSGIKDAVKDKAVRYFHTAVSYYEVLIRHDQNVTDKMKLGRYGVVRNNAYNLTINTVSGPGTPWVPDPTDPTDPTDPDEPDDQADAYLSVSITVNPWTVWSQGVDL